MERALEPILSKPPSIHQSATVSALTAANAALVTCRQTLRYVYIAKYFIPEKCPLLDIFQKNHDDFESHTGALVGGWVGGWVSGWVCWWVGGWVGGWAGFVAHCHLSLYLFILIS